MTLTEMETIAQKTLCDFITTMPDVPFTEDDIIIEFAPRKKMVERAKALCTLCVSEKTFNDNFLFDDSKQGGTRSRETFKNCLLTLRGNLEKAKPWQITKDYIEELGTKYIMFVSMNSVYLGFWSYDE